MFAVSLPPVNTSELDVSQRPPSVQLSNARLDQPAEFYGQSFGAPTAGGEQRWVGSSCLLGSLPAWAGCMHRADGVYTGAGAACASSGQHVETCCLKKAFSPWPWACRNCALPPTPPSCAVSERRTLFDRFISLKR